MLLGLMAGTALAAAPFHIGVVTGTVSQSEDDLRGAEALIKAYGDVAKGGMIKHITYPDNFMSEMETTISQIVGLADDPQMKVIVVNQAIPGTTEAFRRVKEKRPDILLMAGEPHEDPNVIGSVAHIAVNADNVARGYLIIAAAKKMGANTFVHISFPRHMSYELLSRRRASPSRPPPTRPPTWAWPAPSSSSSRRSPPGSRPSSAPTTARSRC
jgi:hypothetical protein